MITTDLYGNIYFMTAVHTLKTTIRVDSKKK